MRYLIRADASIDIGTGHVMRCLALAQAMHDGGGEAACVTAAIPPALGARVRDEGLTILDLATKPYGADDARETAAHAKGQGAEWIIVDGYGFSAAYQDALKNDGFKILFIDDYGHAQRYSADCVLNQNIGASADPYLRRAAGTELLLGTRFVLLQRPFRDPPRRIRETPALATRLLVTLGGSDPQNVTPAVIDALGPLTALKSTIVIGTANPRRAEIESLCARAGMRCVVDAPNLRPLMEEADIAIAGGGTTNYELAALGIPTLTITLAENQQVIAEGMAAAGASAPLGWYADLTAESICKHVLALAEDREQRHRMAENGRRLVDGEGVERVLMHMRQSRLRLRRARAEDADLLWAWANDPVTRQASFDPAPIPWEEHCAWLLRTLEKPDALILIALDGNDNPVGYVRCERKEERRVLSVAIAPQERGKGWSKDVVTAGVRTYFHAYPDERMHAFVKAGNAPSIGLFRSLGWREEEQEQIRGTSALHFVLDRDTLVP